MGRKCLVYGSLLIPGKGRVWDSVCIGEGWTQYIFSDSRIMLRDRGLFLRRCNICSLSIFFKYFLHSLIGSRVVAFPFTSNATFLKAWFQTKKNSYILEKDIKHLKVVRARKKKARSKVIFQKSNKQPV